MSGWVRDVPSVVLDAGGKRLQAENPGAGIEEVPHVVKVVEGDEVGTQDAL